MAAMLANANLFISAWDSSLLVGFARAVSDYSYATYVIDLAVREQYQRKGVGRRLLAEVKALGGPDTSLILLATPGAETYYPHLGFTRHDSAWILRPGQNLY
jgi:GNAT superfamily N-acetyltransferase